MAVQSYALIGAALSTVISDVANNINRAVIGAQIAPVRAADNKNITWDAQTGTEDGSATGGVADGADVVAYDNDTYTPASLDYVTYQAPFAVNGRAFALAKASASPAALRDLFLEGLSNSGNRLASKIGTDFYTGLGSGSNQIHGLLHATIPAIGDVGVYAGIDRAVVGAQWQGTVVAAGGQALSEGLIAALDRGIFNKSGQSSRVFVCDAFQFDQLGALQNANKRYIQEVRTASGTIKLGAGWNALEWRGNAVIRDQKCPAGYFIGLNPEELNFYDASAESPMYGAQGSMMVGGTPEEQGMGDRKIISVRLQPLAKTGDSHKFALYAYVQLRVRRPIAHGFISGLATS